MRPSQAYLDLVYLYPKLSSLYQPLPMESVQALFEEAITTLKYRNINVSMIFHALKHHKRFWGWKGLLFTWLSRSGTTSLPVVVPENHAVKQTRAGRKLTCRCGVTRWPSGILTLRYSLSMELVVSASVFPLCTSVSIDLSIDLSVYLSICLPLSISLASPRPSHWPIVAPGSVEWCLSWVVS